MGSCNHKIGRPVTSPGYLVILTVLPCTNDLPSDFYKKNAKLTDFRLSTGTEAIRTTVVPISGVIRTTVVPISGVIGPTVVRIANATGIGYRHDGSIRFSNKLTYVK